MESSLGNVSQSGRKIKPAQIGATTAAFTCNKPNSSPQQPSGKAGLLSTMPCRWRQGSRQGEVVRGSSHLGLYFRAVTCWDYTEAVCMFQKTSSENTSQSKGTCHLILSTRLADLMVICLGRYHRQKSDKCPPPLVCFRSKDSLLSWRFPICSLLYNAPVCFL